MGRGNPVLNNDTSTDIVRVQLLNSETGTVIKDVDIYTSAKAVTFSDGKTLEEKFNEGLKGVKGDPGPVGPAGPVGPQGPDGPQGQQGPAGPQGTQGLTGPQGEQGPVGSRIYTGLGAPTADQYLVGDVYVDTKDNIGTIYTKTSTGWSTTGSIRGPIGPQGTQGSKGDKGDPGSGITITGTVNTASALPSTANDGNCVLAIDTKHVHVYSASKKQWIDTGILTGIKGEKGEPGPAGPAGAKGTDGKNGTNAYQSIIVDESVPTINETSYSLLKLSPSNNRLAIINKTASDITYQTLPITQSMIPTSSVSIENSPIMMIKSHKLSTSGEYVVSNEVTYGVTNGSKTKTVAIVAGSVLRIDDLGSNTVMMNIRGYSRTDNHYYELVSKSSTLGAPNEEWLVVKTTDEVLAPTPKVNSDLPVKLVISDTKPNAIANTIIVWIKA